MTEKEKREVSKSKPVETTRVVDGVTYRIRIIPARNNGKRLGIGDVNSRWTPNKEITSFDQKGRGASGRITGS